MWLLYRVAIVVVVVVVLAVTVLVRLTKPRDEPPPR